MDVFISYARSNEAQSLLVADALRSSGFRVWRDDELPAHRAYAEVIEERLRSAKAVVVLWSVDAARSQWVRAEADVARNAGTLVQASLDGTIPPIPFNQIQSADLSGWNGKPNAKGWNKLHASVAALAGADAAVVATDARRPPRVLGTKQWPLVAAATLAAGALGLIGVRYAQETEPRMLAVLPFEASKGADADLAEGLSEELISQLSENRGLRVIGRTSAWQYKGKSVDLRTVGRQLGVDYLVEGNVARAGNQLRIAVSLVRTRDGSAMWSRVYTASNQQTPLIRGAIGTGVAAALGVPAEAVGSGYRPKGEAYALYVRAKALFRERTNVSMENARTLLLEAIRIDPRFAPPWAYLGGITHLLGENRVRLDPSRPDGPSMTPVQALEHALKLDPNLAEAHGLIGWIGGPWSAEGAAHLQRAVELEPNNPQILFWWSLAQIRQGNYAGHAEAARKAAALDPLWHRAVTEAVAVSVWAGDEAAVRRYVDRIRAGNPDGATEVESDLATERGDYSRAIDLELRDRNRPYQQSTSRAALLLITLGFEREGLMLGQFGPQEILYNSQRVPDRATLLRLAADHSDFDYGLAFHQLRIHGRYSDIAALYDAAVGDFREIRRATFANRALRFEFGGQVAQALQKVGRRAEAAQLLRLAEDADQAVLGFGQVAPCDLALIAANAAVAGRREEAIAWLQKANERFYCAGTAYDGRVDPIFESLRGDPRFERLVRREKAQLQKERGEVLALGVL